MPDLAEFLEKEGRGHSPLLILTHDHPDPDCMASAFALATLAEKAGMRSRIVYRGSIGRNENQWMARTLHIPIHPLRENDLERYKSVALVDTQPPFQNNAFPKRRKPAIVVDHHPRNSKTQAEFLWIDETVGATATLLTEAMRSAQLEPASRLATALAYGIGSETQNLGREAGPRDVSAYLALMPRTNPKLLGRIQHPPRERSFFEILGRAIQNAFVYRTVIGVHLGPVQHPDHVAQTADFLLTLEKMRWSICTGRYKGQLHVSLRSTNPKARAGRLLRKLLGGSGGGHQMIAGGAIPLGAEASEQAWHFKEEALTLEFLKALGFVEPFELQFPFNTTPPTT